MPVTGEFEKAGISNLMLSPSFATNNIISACEREAESEDSQLWRVHARSFLEASLWQYRDWRSWALRGSSETLGEVRRPLGVPSDN